MSKRRKPGRKRRRAEAVRRLARRRRREGRGIVATWRRALAADWLWFTLLILAGSFALLPPGLLFVPSPVEGEIATRDYVAVQDLPVPDEETTAALKQRARDSVLPIYDFDGGMAGSLDESFASLFVVGRVLLERPTDPELEPHEVQAIRTAGLAEATSLRLTPEQVAVLSTLQFDADLEERLRLLVTSLLRTGLVANKGALLEHRNDGILVRDVQTGVETVQVDLFGYRGYPEDVEQAVEAELARARCCSRQERALLVDLVTTNVLPNISANLNETRQRREAAASATEPVFTQVRSGQVIVRKGDEIDASAVRIVQEMFGNRRFTEQLMPVLGNALLLGLVGASLWIGLIRRRLGAATDARTFGGVVLLLILALLATKLGLDIAGALGSALTTEPFNSVSSLSRALPLATLALLASLLYGRATALLVAVCYAVLIGRLMPADPLAGLIYTLGGCLAAIFALDQLKQRSAITRAGMLVGGMNMVTVLMLFTFSQSKDSGAALGFDLVCALLSGLLVAAAASFLLPVLESILSVTTDIKLIELSDTNLPLLRRVAFEAPGTFQHSLMVAHLATAGCERIGANPVLAYTGGLYHDIGKVLRPAYFVENQHDGVNRHDKLAPSMSALIVTNHVKEGAEMAREHHLPQPIVDAIEQHHGTRRLSFFYERAKEQASEGEEVPEAKYRYAGPKPQNKVMGVLMYADAVEAASRTLVDPGPVAIRSLLDRLLDDMLQDDQLDETDLTLSDLRQVKEAFQGVLERTYHRRVDYPGFDFNGPRARLRVVRGAGG